jgi:hypothetical protein
MTRRNKTNIMPPKPPEPVILGVEERKAYLGMLHLWRCFDQYFFGLLEMGT